MKKPGRFQSNWQLISGLFVIIIKNKKWWLLPPFFILAFLSLFVALASNQSILPAIYALF